MRPVKFDQSQLHRVAEFSCGDQPWKIEVAQWIKAPRGQGGALDDLSNPAFNIEVWLYESPSNELIGYGALGTSRWTFPDTNNKRTSRIVQIIPFLGVQKTYWGQPASKPKQEQFAYLIMGDLLARASDHWFHDTKKYSPILGLCVHPNNARAIKFYQNWGFSDLGANESGHLRKYINVDGGQRDWI